MNINKNNLSFKIKCFALILYFILITLLKIT